MSAKIGSLTEAMVAASAGTGSCLPNSSMTKGLFRDTASAARAEIQLFTKTLGSTPKVVLACTKEAWKLSGWHTSGITHQLDAVLSEQHMTILLWVSEHVRTLMWVDAKQPLQKCPCMDSRCDRQQCTSQLSVQMCVAAKSMLGGVWFSKKF